MVRAILLELEELEFEDLLGLFDTPLLDKRPQERKVFEEAKEQFNKRKTKASKIFRLSTLFNTKVSWESFDELKKIFSRSSGGMPKISERDQRMDDAVFGWQFLNGCNPNSVRPCEVLPPNFPTTEDFLDRGKSLDHEMKVFQIRRITVSSFYTPYNHGLFEQQG